MSEIKILVWKTRDAVGEPEVEVKVPVSMAKWVPKMMAFVPRKTRAEVWGDDADFAAIFGNLEQIISEAAAGGPTEIADVKTRDSHVKVLIEK